MYTQCPACKTVYRVQIGQLQAADGQVRCSRCLATFDALDNLFDPNKAEAEQSKPVANSSSWQQSKNRVATERKPAPGSPLSDSRPAAKAYDKAAHGDTAKPSVPSRPERTAKHELKTATKPASSSPATRAESQVQARPTSAAELKTRSEIASRSVPNTRHGSKSPTTTPVPPRDSSRGMARNMGMRDLFEEPDEAPAQRTQPKRGETKQPSISPRHKEPLGQSSPGNGTADSISRKAKTRPSSGVESASTTASKATIEKKNTPPFPGQASDELLTSTSAGTQAKSTSRTAETRPSSKVERAPAPTSGTTTEKKDIPPFSAQTIEELLKSTPGDAQAEPARHKAATRPGSGEAPTTPPDKAPRSGEKIPPIFSAEAIEALLNPEMEKRPAASASSTERTELPRPDIASSHPMDTGTETKEKGDESISDMDIEALLKPVRTAAPTDTDVSRANTTTVDRDTLSEEGFAQENDEQGIAPALESQASEEPGLASAGDSSPDEGTGSSEPAQEAAQEQEPTYALPPELKQPPSGGGMLGGFLWGVGILLMFAALGLQYIYYYRQAFAANPNVRPVLTAMCKVTGCELPPRRDLSAIVLGDHLIQSHPRYKDSLLITATLINRAKFAQPYPVLEVIMTDLQQHEIARRRFLPKEYLVGMGGSREFAPGAEVPVMLEVLDPGKQAVGFEFNFY